MWELAAILVPLAMGTFGAFVAFVIGWVARGERERQRVARSERRRRAVVGSRGTVARPGTHPARVSRAILDRGKVVQPEDDW